MEKEVGRVSVEWSVANSLSDWMSEKKLEYGGGGFGLSIW
jgi:hypothetical protein